MRRRRTRPLISKQCTSQKLGGFCHGKLGSLQVCCARASILPPLQDSNFDKEVIDVVRVDGKDCWYCATTGLQYDLETNGDWRKEQMVSPAISLQISAHSRSATQHDGRLA